MSYRNIYFHIFLNKYLGYIYIKLNNIQVREWRIGLTTLPPSCANCLELQGASALWSPKGLSRPVIG
jgi:hypothetical protein